MFLDPPAELEGRQAQTIDGVPTAYKTGSGNTGGNFAPGTSRHLGNTGSGHIDSTASGNTGARLIW